MTGSQYRVCLQGDYSRWCARLRTGLAKVEPQFVCNFANNLHEDDRGARSKAVWTTLAMAFVFLKRDSLRRPSVYSADRTMSFCVSEEIQQF